MFILLPEKKPKEENLAILLLEKKLKEIILELCQNAFIRMMM